MENKKSDKRSKLVTRLVFSLDIAVIYIAGLLLFGKHPLFSILLILPLSYFCYLLYKNEEVEQCHSKKK